MLNQFDTSNADINNPSQVTGVAHKRLVSVIAWIDQRFKITLPGNKRSRIACGCLDVALEHQAAIAVLCEHQLYGSLFSLVRVLVDAYVRGVWFHRCASEEDLNRFERDKLDKTFGAMVEEIEAKLGLQNSHLSVIKSSYWKALSSFTHTGFMQVVRRNSAQHTGPNYSDDEVVNTLNFSGILGLWSAAELANIADNHDLEKSVLTEVQEYAHRN